MATRDEILTKLNDRIDAEKPKIDAVESAVFQDFGHYLQVLPVQSQTPEDGNERVPDRLDRKPDDMPLTANDAASRYGSSIPSPNLAQWYVHVYESPQGWGYQIIFEHKIGGKLNRRVDNVGPRTDLAHGWVEVTENV